MRRVGEGSFKQTFLVTDNHGKELALKLYKAIGSTARDEREIKAMLRCRHPNVAQLLSVGEYNAQGQRVLAITEEYLPGGTLTSKAQVSVPQALKIGSQLIDAVAHIASLDLVHRDIKPDNIMFRADGITPVITDFGVVRDLADSSVTPTWAPRGPGTPFFAAPEQLNNQKALIDWRTDEFTLGVVLAYVTFDDHPYRIPGATDSDVVNRVSSRRRPAPWFARHASEQGLPALLKMIEPWSVDRYRKPTLLREAWAAQKG